MKRVALAAGVVASLATSGIAHADPFRESGFALDVRGAALCWMEPAALHVDADCTQDELAKPRPAVGNRSSRFGFAYVHARDSHEPLGVMQIVRMDVANGYADQTYAELTAKGARDSAVRVLPAGTPLTVDPPHIEHNGETRFFSIVVRIGEHDGPAGRIPGTESWALQVPAKSAAWSVTFTASGQTAAAMQSVVEQTKPTLALDAKERPLPIGDPHEKSAAYNLGYRLGQGLVIVLIGGIVAAVLLTQRRREQRARRLADEDR